MFAKLKILLLSKTEISPKKENQPHCRGYSRAGSELWYKQKRTHTVYNGCHRRSEAEASLGSDSQCGTGTTGPALAGPPQPVPARFSHCFRSWGLLLWTVKFRKSRTSFSYRALALSEVHMKFNENLLVMLLCNLFFSFSFSLYQNKTSSKENIQLLRTQQAGFCFNKT